MKLNVQGIEEIEITDPNDLCNPPPPPIMPSALAVPPGLPVPNPFQPGPSPLPEDPYGVPRTGEVDMPHKTPFWTRPIDNGTRWGRGGELIRRAAEAVDPETWQKGWQASMGGEKPDGEQGSPQSRS